MGIIKATFSAIGGGLGDQWLEVIESGNMSDTTVFAKGVTVRKNDKRNSNSKGTQDVISNGSVIHVYDNQCMLLVDGGKVVDFSAEPGYYKVDNSSAPSLFAGQFGASIKDAFKRIAYSGVPSYKQQVFYINLQEIKGIKFGTPAPVNYFDNFYNSELFLRANGAYSIKITDPIKFYAEAIPRNKENVDINDINEQYRSEFLNAFQSALNKMSVDGIRVSQVTSQGMQLAKYMSTILDDDWKNDRGFEIKNVGINSISYDEESKKLINERNKIAMNTTILTDPNMREAYVQGAVARGIEAAGSNSSGSMGAFMGIGMGMNAGGNFMGAASQSNQAAAQQQAAQKEKEAAASVAANSWKCAKCGHESNIGKFCAECGAARPAPEGEWKCAKCGHESNKGKFCAECGAAKPTADGTWKCPKCGHEGNTGKFCADCGEKKPE